MNGSANTCVHESAYRASRWRDRARAHVSSAAVDGLLRATVRLVSWGVTRRSAECSATAPRAALRPRRNAAASADVRAPFAAPAPGRETQGRPPAYPLERSRNSEHDEPRTRMCVAIEWRSRWDGPRRSPSVRLGSAQPGGLDEACGSAPSSPVPIRANVRSPCPSGSRRGGLQLPAGGRT